MKIMKSTKANNQSPKSKPAKSDFTRISPQKTDSKEKSEEIVRGMKFKEPFLFFKFLLGFWKEEISGKERRVIQIISTIAMIFVNIFIGYTYVNESMVNGWQLWVWLGSIFITLIILISPRKFNFHFNKTWLAVLILFIGAFLLRGTFLESLPFGLHVDEAGQIDFTMRHIYPKLELTLNPFITGASSQPSLYNYIVRLFIFLFGYTQTGFRLPSAIVGALSVVATFFLVDTSQNRRTAWLAAIIMACYQYHIQWSRIGLNNIWATLWVPLALACFLWGWREKWNGGSVLGGIALGLTCYFYSGGMVVFILLIYVFIDLWFKFRSKVERHRLLIQVGKMIAMTSVVASPLIMFVILKPIIFFARGREVFAWTVANITSMTGNPLDYLGFFWYLMVHSFGMYIANVDNTGFYAPGIPFLIGLSAPLFVAGFGWAIYKKQYLIVLWVLSVTILGGILVLPGSSHFISAIPVICWSIAIALNKYMDMGWKKWAYVMFFIILITELIFYFFIYPSVPRGDMNLSMPPLPY